MQGHLSLIQLEQLNTVKFYKASLIDFVVSNEDFHFKVISDDEKESMLILYNRQVFIITIKVTY